MAIQHVDFLLESAPFRVMPRTLGRDRAAIEAMTSAVAHIAIDIAPAAIFTSDETARFMQPMRPSAHFVARDELHFGVRIVQRRVPFDLQTEPAWRIGRIGVDVEIGGAGLRRPGIAQIVGLAEHVGGIARAHQFERARCGRAAVDEAAAAVSETRRLAGVASIRRGAAARAIDRALFH